MSSRLFQTIREERGLVYSVYSFGMPFADIGAWGIYAGTAPEQLPEVMELIEGELTSILRDGITQDELDRAKGSVRGAIALSTEDANSRMSRLGRYIIFHGCTPREFLIIDPEQRKIGREEGFVSPGRVSQ